MDNNLNMHINNGHLFACCGPFIMKHLLSKMTFDFALPKDTVIRKGMILYILYGVDYVQAICTTIGQKTFKVKTIIIGKII